MVGGISVQVGSGVKVGEISVGVGSTSVGGVVGGGDITVGMLTGDASERHPLTKISANNTVIKNSGFRRCLGILVEIFSFFSFSRIVLDLDIR